MTLLQYFNECFKPYLEASSFSDATKTGYKNCILHCSDTLLYTPMASVTDDMANEALVWLTDQGYAPNSVNYTRYALRCCWRLAVDDGTVSSNPFLHTKKVAAKESHKHFTDEELRSLEKVIPYYFEADLFLTALYTTLKKNYIFGLLIDDIPDEGSTLTVSRSGAVYSRCNQFCLSVLPEPLVYHLNSYAMICLRAAKHRQLGLKAIRGDGFNSQNLLFPDKFGHPYTAQRIIEYQNMIREASGVFHFSFMAIYSHNLKYGGLSRID